MRKWQKTLAAFLCAALTACIAGCGPEPVESVSFSQKENAFAVVTDDLGREVVLEQKPERIAVTSASFLEPLHEVGGDVVARPDSKNQMPDFARDKASIGKVTQIDVEKLLAVSPALVIINKNMNEKLIEPLEAAGIRTVVVDMKSYEDVQRTVRLFAKLTGEQEKGEKLLAAMEQEIGAVKEKLPKEQRRVAVIHSTNQGLTVQLEGSIAGSVAQMLGWENVAAGLVPLEKNPDAAPYSLETLVEKNPEIIFVTSMGKLEEIKAGMEKTMAESPAWQSVEAVREKRVYYLPQNLFLLSPGLHYPEAFRLMAGEVYPDRFR